MKEKVFKMSDSHYYSCNENWKKSDKRIKLVVKKRVKEQGDKISNVQKIESLNATEVMRTQLKRRNPFSCSPRKKANMSRPYKNHEDIKLFNYLDNVKYPSHVEHVKTTEGPVSTNDAQITELYKPPTTEARRKCSWSKKFPFDWSLKTRVRFTSCQPFNWCSKLLGIQEAEGVCNFVQCQEGKNKDAPNSAHFVQNIMYWVHPALPWISLFPRLSSEIKSTSNIPPLTENDNIMEALKTAWSQSFRSLFNLLRCGRCDYFYLCSSQSTMLFRAATIGGLPSTSVLITPTTKGIREAFDKEGISYSMPALRQSKSFSDGCVGDGDDSDYDDNNDEDERKNSLNDGLCEDEEDGWLESMGVGKETLPQLRQSKVSQQRVKLRNIDHQNSSVAVVTGSDTQALFNYLLNCKSLIAKTGNLAGIPPTLIAPVAFEGATLKSLSTKQGIVKQGKHLEQQYNLEISGPVLPGIFLGLCKVFEVTQNYQFSAATKVLQATTPFNIIPADLKIDQLVSRSGQNILEQCSSLHTNGLAHIKCENGLYSWETSVSSN